MKKFIALICLFGSILIPVGFLFLCGFLAPPEYVLDKEAIKNPETILPSFSKKAFQYPGVLSGIEGWDEDRKVWLLIFKDKREAKSVFKSYAKKITEGIGIHQSSGPSYHNYKKPEAGLWGRIKLIDEIILHGEARNEERLDQMFDQSGLLIPNPKANVLTDIFQKGRYWSYILILILIYAALQFPIWNRIVGWATVVNPKPEVTPLSESELRRRLLSLNEMDVPFQVFERKGGKIDVVWRLADAKWAGLITLNKVTKVQVIRLKLSEQEKTCRAIDITKSVRATADGLKTAFSFDTFFSRGVTFWQWEFEKQYGLIFKNGGFTFDKVYEYKFSYDELKNPIVSVVTQSGWKYKQMLFLSKILGG
ncbi:MAG: hypothetical protein ACUVWO_05840 [Thermodesulfobacteriota bacterium]